MARCPTLSPATAPTSADVVEETMTEVPMNPVPKPKLWQRLLKETRTRVLLLYGLLLLLTVGLSIPIFRYVLFASVDRRVREDLIEERENFLAAYAEWENTPNQTVGDLKTFVTDQFRENRLEDDNFQVLLIDNQLYRARPPSLIKPLRPGSELFDQWIGVSQYTLDEYKTGMPEIGTILYTVDPLFLDGQQRGTFVTAHSSAGERQEALVGVYLLMRVMSVAVVISLILSWLGTGKIMAPIATLSKTARSISESDLTQRIVISHSDGELADLANTFNAMMDRIQGAFDSQRSFINDAGHELRTPITIIQGHLELLDDDPQENQETIDLVMDELDRMGRLVSDLILLAKSERPHFLQLETIETRKFTEGLYAKAIALIKRNWQLTIEDEITFQGDRQKLTGALINLLRNATQYTQETDTIELGCRVVSSQTLSNPIAINQAANNRQVQFWVRDTGEGIAVADQARVFARFSRGGQRRSDGSGLGLAITSAIVEAHGGQIDLESQPEKGSTFWITLPIA